MAEIISDLINSLEAQKLIPFIGAGFSESCGCPSAHSLAKHLLTRFQIKDAELLVQDDIDLLRLAEYLKIIRGGDMSAVLQQIRLILNEEAVVISESQPHLIFGPTGRADCLHHQL